MDGSFRNSLMRDLEEELGCPLDKQERWAADAMLRVLEHRARHRARTALVEGMSARKRYEKDAEFRHAVDLIAQVAAAGVFGTIPIQDKLNDAMAMVTGTWVNDLPGPVSKELTLAKLKQEWEKQQPSPSGLPAASWLYTAATPKSDPGVMAELLVIVQEKSDALLAEKQTQKFHELMGDNA